MSFVLDLVAIFFSFLLFFFKKNFLSPFGNYLFFSHSGNTTVAQLCAQGLANRAMQQPPATNLGSLESLGLADEPVFQHEAQGELAAYILNINLL